MLYYSDEKHIFIREAPLGKGLIWYTKRCSWNVCNEIDMLNLVNPALFTGAEHPFQSNRIIPHMQMEKIDMIDIFMEKNIFEYVFSA